MCVLWAYGRTSSIPIKGSSNCPSFHTTRWLSLNIHPPFPPRWWAPEFVWAFVQPERIPHFPRSLALQFGNVAQFWQRACEGGCHVRALGRQHPCASALPCLFLHPTAWRPDAAVLDLRVKTMHNRSTSQKELGPWVWGAPYQPWAKWNIVLARERNFYISQSTLTV